MSAIHAALDDYQQFTLTTAQYPEALATPYLALGLGDEAAEVAEKIIIHETKQTLFVMVRSEIGDVLWYLAQLLLRFDIKLSEAYERSKSTGFDFESTLRGSAYSLMVLSGMIQGRVKKSIRDGVDVREQVLHHASAMLRLLDCMATACGGSLVVVMLDNKSKLLDRLERNAIKGEGDVR